MAGGILRGRAKLVTVEEELPGAWAESGLAGDFLGLLSDGPFARSGSACTAYLPVVGRVAGRVAAGPPAGVPHWQQNLSCDLSSVPSIWHNTLELPP